MRTIVDLPEDHVQRLDAMCRAQGISRAEGVRRAVAAYLGSILGRRKGSEAFGIWKGRVRDGLAYQESLRREWE